ncbi:MAG: carboxymuconolactone decarboxylase family protein [Rhizobiaceae bacterium]
MTWIDTISYDAARGRLRKLYDRVKGPDNNVDNIMMAHSLRPHTMEGHMALYKYVLHHSGNEQPKWFLETLGVWVSHLNNCAYCVEHHFQGLRRLLNDDARADAILSAVEQDTTNTAPLNEAQKCAMDYAKILTRDPAALCKSNIDSLRRVGFSDGEILEINQVAAYFSYANRTVLGLGCSTEGDLLGLSPGNSNDPDDWKHS